MPLHYHDERRVNEPGYQQTIQTVQNPHTGEWYYFDLTISAHYGPFDSEDEALEHSRLDLEE